MNPFEIPGKPRGKQRTIPNPNGGRPFTPEQTIEYEKLVRLMFRSANPGVKPYAKGVPVRITIKAMFKTPKSASERQRKLMIADELRPTKKPDADNIEKIIWDALKGVAWEDDAQIVESHCAKYWSSEDYVTVMIDEADMHEVEKALEEYYKNHPEDEEEEKYDW